MKTRNIIAIALMLICMSVAVQGKSYKTEYVITNHSQNELLDKVVLLPVGVNWARSVTVTQAKIEVPSQMDDLDGDGVADQLVIITNFAPAQRKQFNIEFRDRILSEDRYPSRVHAQMFLKQGDKSVAKTEVSATDDNMYNKLLHHGPAFESELIAYRIYFDKKQTLDIYGKNKKGLELEQTMWYPTPQQLAKGAGDDIIRVFSSVGVGALKGWDVLKQTITHFTPVEERTARIVANGPLRTVVEMNVKGWEHRGVKLDIRSRYTLYAGHREVEVEHMIAGPFDQAKLCTGVMKMAEHVSLVNGKGVAAVWGTDYPVNDTVTFAKQTCGLAVIVPQEYIEERCDDPQNYLYQLIPDKNGVVRYTITAASAKEEFGYKTADQFFDYVLSVTATEQVEPLKIFEGRIAKIGLPGERVEKLIVK